MADENSRTISLNKADADGKLYAEQCFERIKNSKNSVTDEYLVELYDTCLALLQKFRVTGQVRGIQKLMYHLDTIERERKVVSLGVSKFVYYGDIQDYIEMSKNKDIKLIELKNYERDIPDEIVETIEKVGKLFDGLYVLFTDYTGTVSKQIKREERTKDPILFGVFKNEETRTIIERFYYLGDWEDEYCNLTLDRMVSDMKKADRENIVHSCELPKNVDDFKEQLSKLVETTVSASNAPGNQLVTYKIVEERGVKSKFKSVKTFLTAKFGKKGNKKRK